MSPGSGVQRRPWRPPLHACAWMPRREPPRLQGKGGAPRRPSGTRSHSCCRRTSPSGGPKRTCLRGRSSSPSCCPRGTSQSERGDPPPRQRRLGSRPPRTPPPRSGPARSGCSPRPPRPPRPRPGPAPPPAAPPSSPPRTMEPPRPLCWVGSEQRPGLVRERGGCRGRQGRRAHGGGRERAPRSSRR